MKFLTGRPSSEIALPAGTTNEVWSDISQATASSRKDYFIVGALSLGFGNAIFAQFYH